jgi:hypothetical protein
MKCVADQSNDVCEDGAKTNLRRSSTHELGAQSPIPMEPIVEPTPQIGPSPRGPHL